MSVCKPSGNRRLVVWLWISTAAVLLLNGHRVEARSPFRHLKGFASRGSAYSPPVNSIGSPSSYASSASVSNPVPAASSNQYSTATGVDPYISGSNNVDTTGSAVSAASAAAAVSQAASSLSNLAASASSNSYASDGYADSHYGSSSGSYGSTGGTYGSSAGSYAGSTGLASYGSSGGGSYGSGGGGGYGGGGGGGYGGGGGNTYTTVTIPGSNQGLDKANALNFLSSLAPSLLLSSLLLPLALAILSNATGALGRRKRGVDSYFDDIEIEDQIDFDVSFLDDNTLKTIDAIIETLDSSSDQSTEQQQAVITFASKRGLFDTGNQCLDKLACLSAEGSKSTLVDSKEASKLRKAMKWITSDGGTTEMWKQRIEAGSKKGRKNVRVCLADFTCQQMKS